MDKRLLQEEGIRGPWGCDQGTISDAQANSIMVIVCLRYLDDGDVGVYIV